MQGFTLYTADLGFWGNRTHVRSQLAFLALQIAYRLKLRASTFTDPCGGCSRSDHIDVLNLPLLQQWGIYCFGTEKRRWRMDFSHILPCQTSTQCAVYFLCCHLSWNNLRAFGFLSYPQEPEARPSIPHSQPDACRNHLLWWAGSLLR